MIADIGKTAAITYKNGNTYSFYNRSCIGFDSDINFYDANGKHQYKILKNTDDVSQAHRCGYFSVSLGITPYDDGNSRLILYIPSDVNVELPGTAVTIYPLYELISPFITNYNGQNCLAWWSNVQNVASLTKYGSLYKYDHNKIKKFSNNNLGDITVTGSSAKFLCVANITWRFLRQSGGGIISDFVLPTPIIRTPVIVTLISGQGYITDFSTGGDGGGLSIHSHISNDDGGFAAAVFMPSASLRPINWK